MSRFEKFEEKLSSKEKFSSSLTGKEICDKDYEHAVECIWNKNNERLSQIVFKTWRFVVKWCIWKV